MPKHNNRILAIDPGTREMGFALLDGYKLAYHGVKVIKAQSSQEKLKAGRKTVLRMINDFRPQFLVVEKAFFGESIKASQLNVLVDQIKAVGRRKKLKVISYAPTTVRKFLCGNGWADKKALSEVIAMIYPELKVYITQDRGWKERYHQNMFDAVALGLMLLYQNPKWFKR